MATYPFTHYRQEWEVSGYKVSQHTTSGPINWSSVDKVVIHYTAAADVPDGDSDELPLVTKVRDYIRAIQRDYVNSRGYSIGYNAVVDQSGHSWQARGEEYVCAANAGVNSSSFAILVLVDGNDPASASATSTIRSIVAWVKTKTNRTVRVVGHKDVGTTSCPGIGLYNQVRTGAFDANPLPPPSGDDDMITIEPKRVYDTRGGAKFGNNEVRRVPVVMGQKAFLNVTVLNAAAPGWVALSVDGSFSGGTSLVNYLPGTVCHNSALVGAPGGHVYVKALTSCDIIIDVYAYSTV